ncbi:MAG: single-stranded DNA-binding protein [Myxococcota bacterium]
MAGVNKAILIGNLGRDPELKYTQSGQAVVNFSIATSENWTDKSGEKQERTEWHRIVAWGKTGELCAQYLSKGRTVYVEGRIQTREWEDREGQKRTTTEINAQTVTFIGGRGDSGGAAGGGGSAAGGGTAGGGGNAAGGGGSEPGPQGGPPSAEDVPF